MRTDLYQALDILEYVDRLCKDIALKDKALQQAKCRKRELATKLTEKNNEIKFMKTQTASDSKAHYNRGYKDGVEWAEAERRRGL